jgi:hypothetical protein
MPITNKPVLTEPNKKWINENSHLYTIHDMEFKIRQDGNQEVNKNTIRAYVVYNKLPYKRDMNFSKKKRRESVTNNSDFFRIEEYKNMIV